MLKYNFKKFFANKIIQTDEWVSDGCFIVNKSILTQGQRKMLEEYSCGEEYIEMFEKILKETKVEFGYNISHLTEEKRRDVYTERLFVPDFIYKSNTKDGEYNALYNSSLDLTLKEEYYNFLTSRKCTIYKGEDSLNPTLVYKGDKFVGVLLPIRDNCESRINAKNYENYAAELKEEEKRKAELRKLNKKCLYIRNNKAITRQIPLIPITDIIGNDDRYSNLYINAEPDAIGNVDIYIDLKVAFMDIRVGQKLKSIKEDIEWVLGSESYNHMTLEWYLGKIDNRLSSGQWINVAEIELAKLAGKNEDYIKRILKLRKDITEKRDADEKEKQLQKEKEEKEYVSSQNKIVEDAVLQAEQDILQGKQVINKDVTIYNDITDRYNSNTTSLILHMMKLYDIKVPLKTQGWVNNALYSIKVSEYQDGYTYDYHTNSSDSTVFYKYLNELVNKVKDKYKNVA